MLRRAYVLLLAVGALTGCGPAENGAVGVTVDAAGDPVGVVVVCDGQVNSATLRIIDRSGFLGEWRPPAPVSDVGTWSLTTGRPWTPQRIARFEAGVRYRLGADDVTTREGTTVGINSATRGVSFTLADLRVLQPGQVLYAADIDDETLAEVPRVVGIEDFRDTACAD